MSNYNPNRTPAGSSDGGQFATGDSRRDEAGQVDAFGTSGASAATDYWNGLSADERDDFVDSRGEARHLVDPPDGMDESERRAYWDELDRLRSAATPHEGTCYDCGGEMFTDSEGITTHIDETGNEDYEANADHIAVDDKPFVRQNIEQMHAQTADLLEQYQRAGELEHVGNGEFRSGRRLLGRTDNGDRVYADVTFRHRQSEHTTTTDLDETDEAYSMAVTFSVVEKGRREASYSGRELEPEHEELVPDGLKLVRDNHLNDLVAGTDRQMEQFRAMQEDPSISRLDLHSHALDNIEPDRGYRFGTKWLYRPVDPKVYREGLAALSALRKT